MQLLALGCIKTLGAVSRKVFAELFHGHGAVGVLVVVRFKHLEERPLRPAVKFGVAGAYLAATMVNWCPKLGTVLANDEVSEGLSVRGGYPVEQKEMWQWCQPILSSWLR